MKRELKRFLQDQKRLKRGLPPAKLPPTRKERREIQRVAASISAGDTVHVQEDMRRVAQRKLSREVPQTCSECHNAFTNGRPVHPEHGRFFPGGGGLLWKCHGCIPTEPESCHPQPA